MTLSGPKFRHPFTDAYVPAYCLESAHDQRIDSLPALVVKAGPHVMIVGDAAREMLSPYPRDLGVKNATPPYVMFPGNPNEHLMTSVHSQELTTGSARRTSA